MTRTSTTKSYSDMRRFDTFEERFDYLKLRGTVGMATFGHERYLNQRFYQSAEWRRIRDQVIARDNGCDLGSPGHEIMSRPLVHHMNPMVINDLLQHNEDILNTEFLITVSHETHNAIHYGDRTLLTADYSPRMPGDTKLW